jgi:hypothetical protein
MNTKHDFHHSTVSVIVEALYPILLLPNFLSQTKKKPPLVTYPSFLLHTLPPAYPDVTKLLNAYHILSKFTDATSCFKISSIFFFIVVRRLRHPYLVTNIGLLAFPENTVVMYKQKEIDTNFS